MPDATLWNGTAVVFTLFILVKVYQIGVPSRINGVSKIVLEFGRIVTINLSEIVVDFGTRWVDAFGKGVDVVVVGAREPNPEGSWS